MLLHENRWHLKNVQMCNAHQSRLAADEQITARITGLRRGEKERKNQRIPFRPSVTFPRDFPLCVCVCGVAERGKAKGHGKRLRAPARGSLTCSWRPRRVGTGASGGGGLARTRLPCLELRRPSSPSRLSRPFAPSIDREWKKER